MTLSHHNPHQPTTNISTGSTILVWLMQKVKNQVIKLCFIAKSVYKHINIMVFFVTIQDSVDDLRIHFLISIIFFSRYDNLELFNQKKRPVTWNMIGLIAVYGAVYKRRKKHLIWFHLPEISTRRCKYNFLKNRQKLFACLQLLIDLLMYMYIIHDSVLVSCSS